MTVDAIRQRYLDTPVVHPESAPDIVLVRADYAADQSAMPIVAAELLVNGLLTADWMRPSIGDERTKALRDNAASKYYVPYLLASQRIIAAAVTNPLQHSAWFAVQKGAETFEAPEDFVFSELHKENRIVGFADANNDVSGSRLALAVKRQLFPERIFAKLANVAVAGDKRSQGLGTVISLQALEMFKWGQVSTVYTPTANRRLITSLTEIGYIEDEATNPRDDIVPGVFISESRLVAECVNSVRDALRQRLDRLP